MWILKIGVSEVAMARHPKSGARVDPASTDKLHLRSQDAHVGGQITQANKFTAINVCNVETSPDDQYLCCTERRRFACGTPASLSAPLELPTSFPTSVLVLHCELYHNHFTSASHTNPQNDRFENLTMATNAPTLINLPPPPSDPATPSEIP